jgi:5-methylcytosine-specific restriction endonuclease McrA
MFQLMSWNEKRSDAATKRRSTVYRTARWKKLRAKKIEAVGYQCERCSKLSAHPHVHHKHALEDGGAPFDIENLEALCARCHSSETMHEQHDRRRREEDAKSKHGVMLRDADGWGMSWEERQAAKRGRN